MKVKETLLKACARHAPRAVIEAMAIDTVEAIEWPQQRVELLLALSDASIECPAHFRGEQSAALQARDDRRSAAAAAAARRRIEGGNVP